MNLVAGNYGFVYISGKIKRKLRKYLGWKKWRDVGSISLQVDRNGPVFVIIDQKFKSADVVNFKDVMGE